MKQIPFYQIYEDFTLDKVIYLYVDGELLQIPYKEDVRMIDGIIHPIINIINLN